MMTPQEFLTFVKADFDLSPLQEEQFLACEGLYQEWNARINVISRKDIDALYDHHILHSLAIARYLLTEPDALAGFRSEKVLDLGTGGGFPGIPLAILFPEAQFTLCDSVGKKTIVAKAVSEALELKNVTVINDRAERLSGPFGWVVSRAVASLPDFYPWVKGKFTRGILCLKGGDVVEEIAGVMERFHLPKGSVHTWNIDSWLQDPYYAGKLVIHLEK